jgi:hypothetical protein
MDISAAWRRQRKGMGLDQESLHPRCSRPLSAMTRILRRSLNPETCGLRSSPAASVFSLAAPRASSALRPRPSPEPSMWHRSCSIGMPVIGRTRDMATICRRIVAIPHVLTRPQRLTHETEWLHHLSVIGLRWGNPGHVRYTDIQRDVRILGVRSTRCGICVSGTRCRGRSMGIDTH